MRAYVFTDAALAKHAGRFVWLSIETEKPSGEAFLEKFPMEAWPTLFVIDPVTEKAELKWLGSANVQQLEKLLDDGDFAVHRAWARGGPPGEGPEDALAAADHLSAAGEHAAAAQAYGTLLGQVPADWPRRGRVVESLVFELQASHNPEACAARAVALVPGLPKGPSFANAASIGLSCAADAPPSAPWRAGALAALEPLAREAVALPGLLADDRSGLYEQLVELLEARGDKEGARKLSDDWWAFLQRAVDQARTPEARAAFDPHRVLAAEHAGDPARMLPSLEASERDLPADYNAPARMALVYRELGRYDDALAANARALAKVYGPRTLRVLQVEAELYEKKGDLPAAKKALGDALAFAERLPAAQRPEGAVKRLKARLEELGKKP